MSAVVGVGIPVLVMVGALAYFWLNAPDKAVGRAATLMEEPGLESLDRDGLMEAEATMAARVRLACIGATVGLVIATVVVATLDLGSITEEYGTYAVVCVLLAGAMAGAALIECVTARRSVRPLAGGPRVAALSRRTLASAPGRGQRALPLVWVAVAMALGVVAVGRGDSFTPYAAASGAALLAFVGIGGTAVFLTRAPRHATDAGEAAVHELVLRDSVARLTAHLGHVGVVTALFAWSVASQRLGFAAIAVLAVVVVCGAALNTGWRRFAVAAR